MPKVSVPASAGESIVLTQNGAEPIHYKVTDGTTNVGDEHLDKFLKLIPGSKTVVGSPSAKPKEQ